MSGRIVIRNRSRYATVEVRDLVKFAVSELDMRGVCINVKNSRGRGAGRGMAYMGVPYVSDAPPSSEYLITLGLAAPENFPKLDQFYAGAVGAGSVSGASRQWPRYDLFDWREALVHLAAHEARHIEQYKNGERRSELVCEHFASYMLRRYRNERP